MPKIKKSIKVSKKPKELAPVDLAPKTEATTPAGAALPESRGEQNLPAAVKLLTKIEVKKISLEQTGQAVVLARLAEEFGMGVSDIVQFPEKMIAAGLPEKPEHWLCEIAHQLNRNAIDAWLYRKNRFISEKAPEPSWEEAKIEAAKPTEAQQYIEKAKQKKANEANESSAIETKHSKIAGKAPSMRTQVFGFAATAVVRALGKKGIAFDKIKVAMTKQGCVLSDSTLKIQIRAGTTGDASRGEPAKLTPAQEKQLLS